MLHSAGRLDAGHTPLALDGGGQCAALAADKGAGAPVDMQTAAEVRTQNVVTQKSGFLCLRNGQLQALNSQRILRADIDIALLRAYGIGRDQHTLDHPVGIALHDAAVHKRAGVALIAVADHIADGLLLSGHLAPFFAGGEARAAAAPELGVGNSLNDGLGRHFKEGFFKALVSAGSNGRLNALRVDMAAVLQHQAGLLGVEGDLLLRGIDLVILTEHQPLHRLTPEDRFFKDLAAVALLHL